MKIGEQVHKIELKLVILDRDGVINKDSDAYIKSPGEWQPIEKSLAAIARLNRAGILVGVATNQSGLARKLFSQQTLDKMHAKLTRLLSQHNGHIDALVYCPHGPEDQCDCRKPKPGLYHQISEQLNQPLANCIVIGDSLRDLQAAATVDATPILVRTGKGRMTEKAGELPAGTQIFDNLSAAVEAIFQPTLT